MLHGDASPFLLMAIMAAQAWLAAEKRACRQVGDACSLGQRAKGHGFSPSRAQRP